MKFTDAGTPEIIRSSQKDHYYLSYLRRHVADCVQSLFGPGIWIKWRHDLDFLADLGYFLLTTVSGFQTLGEEYVNIVQVDVSRRDIPGQLRRIILVLCHVSVPYIIKKILSHWEFILTRDSQMDAKQKEVLLKCISVVCYATTVVHRCHMALFYIQGVFYHLAKRFTGIHYLLVRSGLEGRNKAPSFRWLGYLSLIQLTGSLVQQYWKHSRSPLSVEGDCIEESQRIDDYVPPSQRCPLCLESRRQSTVTPCGHVFCWKCITEWISSKNECPLCRERFGMSRLVPLQNYDPR